MTGGGRRFVVSVAGLVVLVALMVVPIGGAAGSQTVAVARVIDGDTLALTNGKRVRLVQIDAPEVGSGECYSRKSRSALLRLAPVGSRITLEADSQLDKVDQYGRLLRYVRRNGVNVHIRLVLDGAAAPWFYGERGKYAERLVSAVSRAKASKRGLWRACPGTVLSLTGPLQTRAGTIRPPRTVTPQPPASSGSGSSDCHPSYKGACLDPDAYDYDCAGGSGNGPLYTGRVQVVGPDDFGLDGDADGWGCE